MRWAEHPRRARRVALSVLVLVAAAVAAAAIVVRTPTPENAREAAHGPAAPSPTTGAADTTSSGSTVTDPLEPGTTGDEGRVAPATAAERLDAATAALESELREAPATAVLARGERFVVEHLELDAPATVAGRDGAPRLVESAARIVIHGDFPVRAMPPVVLAGDTDLGAATELPELDGIALICFEPELLTDGTVLGYRYGDDIVRVGEVQR